jgi:ABC-type multidrug transport system ATPase subunit
MDEIRNSSIVIETKNISKRYKEVQAVDGLNLKIRKGEIYGLLGPNGAGKSTTIKMILSLTHPTSGEALVNGKKVSDIAVDIRRDIGYLPERIAFYNNLTPVQTLSFFCELQGVDKSVIEPLLKEVGLEKDMNRKVGTFSKGMVQLVGVTQAMLGDPSIYILDEPMGGLDPRWVKVVRDKIRALHKKGATVMFSSHILSEVQALCDRVAIINKGKLIAEDTVENISKRLNIRPKLEITIKNLKDKVPESLHSIEKVESALAKGDTLYITCDHEARTQVIALLQKEGYEIKDFRTVEPTLEEAFIKLISEEEEVK